MKPKIAIALQGGGSHAAFAAGVLQTLLEPERFSRFELVGLSGTSGGAVCAALAWSGLVSGAGNPALEAARRLAAFWRDLEADDVADAVLNLWGVWLARMPVSADVSPYTYVPMAAGALRGLLERHVRLAELPTPRPHSPRLYLGATEILNGRGCAFEGQTLTYDDIVASAAIPPLFRAVAKGHELYWDGLFSRNPPVREFTDLPRDERPDEMWVVRINPKRRLREPRAMPEIVDRRNELSGNLALDQELYFVDKINELRRLSGELAERYKHIEVREIELDRPDLDYPSKLDRSPDLIRSLMRDGSAQAKRLLAES
jgi:NTE family protein